MKKSAIILFLLCVVTLFSAAGCNSNKASLIYDKKYYLADDFDRANKEANDRYIIFFKDGTGEYYGSGYENYGGIEFRYYLAENSVHCFWDGGYVSDYEGTNWNKWFWVGDGILHVETSRDVQYINEEKLLQFPNFGS